MALYRRSLLDSAHIRVHIPGSVVQNKVLQTETAYIQRVCFTLLFVFHLNILRFIRGNFTLLSGVYFQDQRSFLFNMHVPFNSTFTYL
jgi:hypothetical protein